MNIKSVIYMFLAGALCHISGAVAMWSPWTNLPLSLAGGICLFKFADEYHKYKVKKLF